MPGVGKAMTATGTAEMPGRGRGCRGPGVWERKEAGPGWKGEGPSCPAWATPLAVRAGPSTGTLVPGAVSSEPGGAAEHSDEV